MSTATSDLMSADEAPLALGAGPTEVHAWPGVVGGVLRESPLDVETLSDYRAAGGYAVLSASLSEVYEILAQTSAVTGLSGRGGAAFPFWRKLQTARSSFDLRGVQPVVIGNGAEGEPLSVKDRYLMRHRPHLIVDGLALTAAAVNAQRATLYVEDSRSRAAVQAAIEEADSLLDIDIDVVIAQDTYVAGEESAVVRAIEHGIARPIERPPHIYESGVGGAPTMVSNVETLARVARAMAPNPAAGEAPFLVTVSAPNRSAAVVEIPEGLGVAEFLYAEGYCSPDEPPAGVLAGGFFGGVLPLTEDLVFSWESFKQKGGGLGCASIYVIPRRESVLPVASKVATYYAQNNAQQCRSCMSSTRDIAAHLTTTPPPMGYQQNRGGDPLDELTRWSTQIVGRGACALPNGVALMLRSLLRHFPDELNEHLELVSKTRAVEHTGPVWPRGVEYGAAAPSVPVPTLEALS
ncbi:NADH-ubiquinone oxidoreductase-F iron-sulfur binding region domain-containing protein [Rhodococcus sp. JT-3]|uniref:NADH-ubiquinone oxidoreductase-F iron-sulfur binding region domain-containing protein n=1 Tax=Rhodococcus sp. JT-3 TaxID=1973213 RepID=UPI0013038A90|nr:NADH-ubiquinone oxidoreductase-F iron-sulfur binding region domain-containing protein [Rhodococcus sp. JT-3]